MLSNAVQRVSLCLCRILKHKKLIKQNFQRRHVRGIHGYVCRGTGYDIFLDADIVSASRELIHLALEANNETTSSQAPAPAAPTTTDVWARLTDNREAKMADMV